MTSLRPTQPTPGAPTYVSSPKREIIRPAAINGNDPLTTPLLCNWGE